MTATLCLAGDTMLGRGVAERLEEVAPKELFADEVIALARSADAMVLNLECCISDRGERWPAPGKPFFFRAPPAAVGALELLGVRCVTLANNHALDFGFDALIDTLVILDDAGVAHVGAGRDLAEARASVTIAAGELDIEVMGVTDHPADFAATTDRPGVAFADLPRGVPAWLTEQIASSTAGAVLVTPHWGPNMNPAPLPYVETAAGALLECGATVVAGHSAHVFQGAAPPVMFDLGDFIDDYAVDPHLRNDLGLMWFAMLDGASCRRLEAVPLKLDYCHTRLAAGDDYEWIATRLMGAGATLGGRVRDNGTRLAIEAA